MSDGEQSSGRAALLGGGASVLTALCCFAGPAILGAVAGATISRTLGIVAAMVARQRLPSPSPFCCADEAGMPGAETRRGEEPLLLRYP